MKEIIGICLMAGGMLALINGIKHYMSRQFDEKKRIGNMTENELTTEYYSGKRKK